MSKISETRAVLDSHGVIYEFMEHPAVMTVDEFRLQQVYGMGIILKNLFLRDDSGKQAYMYSCRGEKRADLKKLAETLQTKRVCFASEERLMRCTGLTPGSVSPLGLIFDTEREVTMVFDKELLELQGRIGIHPGENTATVFLEFSELVRVLEELGTKILYI
ncbi:MAG: prolyl-tRNA synthetase associated domain-containing protein [Defluviitaleaceae bacterium]|nr:prolyl-tRNA synthetase associated domain-containing protein [Defluviitaleaceae bacterium]